jgi:hypothetical protein
VDRWARNDSRLDKSLCACATSACFVGDHFMSKDAASEVRFGALIAASARVVRAAWPAVLLVWLSRGLLEATTPILRALVNAETGYATRSFTALPWLVGLILAVVSGIFIRWLLERRRDTLSLDVGLVVYVILIEAARIMGWAAFWLFRPGPRYEMTTSQIALRSGLGLVTNLLLELGFAAVSLWPIALMLGDRLSLPAAIRRMGQAYGWWLLTVILLGGPSFALAQFDIWVLHHVRRNLQDHLMQIAFSSLTTTLSTVVLAQIYARRVRGIDLQESNSAVG